MSSNRVRPVEARQLTARERLINSLKTDNRFEAQASHGGYQLASVVPINEINSRNNNRRYV